MVILNIMGTGVGERKWRGIREWEGTQIIWHCIHRNSDLKFPEFSLTFHYLFFLFIRYLYPASTSLFIRASAN